MLVWSHELAASAASGLVRPSIVQRSVCKQARVCPHRVWALRLRTKQTPVRRSACAGPRAAPAQGRDVRDLRYTALASLSASRPLACKGCARHAPRAIGAFHATLKANRGLVTRRSKRQRGAAFHKCILQRWYHEAPSGGPSSKVV